MRGRKMLIEFEKLSTMHLSLLRKVSLENCNYIQIGRRFIVSIVKRL